jgi:O-antigen/teichoic acid export membrane protein
VQLADLLLVAPGAIGIVVFRRGASGHGDHWDDFVRATRWTLVLALVAGAVTAALAEPLLELIFGDDYGDAATALRLLVPGIVVLAVQSVVSHYVASRGRPRAVMVAWAVAAVAMIVGDLLVIPDHGIEGAAVVSSLGYALCLVLHVPAPRAAHRPAAAG